MRHAMERGWWMIALLVVDGIGLTGCMQQETRFLSCLPRSPGVEARSYDLHDPFPDEEVGPKTGVRPRAFQVPRDETRKTNDLRFLQAAREFAPRTHAFWDPLSPTGTAHAPIQPIWRTRSSPEPIAIAPRMWDGSTRYNVVGP